MPDRQPPSNTPTSRLIAKAYESFRLEDSGVAAVDFHHDPCRDLSRRKAAANRGAGDQEGKENS